jgi:hypothetical protein
MAADPAVAPLVKETADWLASVALPDGRVPHVLPTAAAYPAAPWMQPNEGGMLTFAIVGHLWELGADHPWLDAATAWCWAQIEAEGGLVGGYPVKFALHFLDAVPEPDRATQAIERVRPLLRADGTIPVDGGQDDEQLRPLDLSPRPGAPSRALFSADQVSAELDRLESGQLDDGGWEFDFLHWSPGQAVDWRGIVTLGALQTLRAHGRLP